MSAGVYLGIFLGVWVAVAIVALVKRQSWVVTIGGGFLAGCVALAVAAVLTTEKKPEPRRSHSQRTGSSPARSTDPDSLARDFLADHREFGSPIEMAEVPDWVDGPRRRVTTSTGRTLVFYFKNGRVVTVREQRLGEGLPIVWGQGSG